MKIATQDDLASIQKFTRAMMLEMASCGGYPLSERDNDWDTLYGRLNDQLGDPKFRYLLAQASDPQHIGFAGAEIRRLEAPRVHKPVLHVNSIYVRPESRRAGLASSMLLELLNWGRECDCFEADLNVVDNSPAIKLYEKHGFSVFRRNLVCKL